ncbi:ATP-binding protein [Pseudomonas putida]|uniref:ATP-binding protein n=1 Tax=Pseudomonas putida TaxID=303 RepID=UPI0033592316
MNTKNPTLWRWIGWRITVVTILAVGLIAVVLMLKIQFWDWQAFNDMPEDIRGEFFRLQANPEANKAQLWRMLQDHFDIDYFMPGVTGRDWWTLIILVATAIPVLTASTFFFIKPLSGHLTAIAKAARSVSSGNLEARLPDLPDAPIELKELTADFNGMVASLQQYELDVKYSSGILAHELRTPLAAASGRLQGMIDGVFDPEIDQLVMVKKQLDSLNSVINDLLLISVAQNGQLPLSLSSFSLVALINERVCWFSPQLKGVDVGVTSFCGEIDMITADRNRIGQLLNIVLDNFVRYAIGGAKLDIDVEVEGDFYTIKVGDRGPGIQGEEFGKMFHRFWRAEPSRTRASGGAGLGLSIAHAVCIAHGGTVGAEARSGGGLVFIIRLPIAA